MILDSLCDLKCKTSHSRNLEIGTLGKAPPCCSRTRHKFEATKCQSHHTWQMCLPNSPSETSSHLVMMSHVSWVSHSKSPMMYPRCPESRYKKEEYPVTYHCHLHVPGFSWKSCSHHFFTKLHSNINISFKLPRFQKKIGCLGLYWWETARHCGAEQTSPRFFLQKFPQRNAENLSLAPHLSLAFESRPRTEPPWSSKAQCLNGKTWPKQRFKGSVGTKRAPWFSEDQWNSEFFRCSLHQQYQHRRPQLLCFFPRLSQQVALQPLTQRRRPSAQRCIAWTLWIAMESLTASLQEIQDVEWEKWQTRKAWKKHEKPKIVTSRSRDYAKKTGHMTETSHWSSPILYGSRDLKHVISKELFHQIAWKCIENCSE